MRTTHRNEETYLELQGGVVFVKQWTSASPSGPPLFLLHDSLGCVDLWRDFPATLVERLGRTVIAYDRLGFGRSSARGPSPKPNFIQEEAESIFPAVRAGLGVGDFTLFGHSVGGAMALVAAARAGQHCKAVITESAQAFVEDRTIAGVQSARTQFENPEQFERLRKWHGEKARWVLNAWIEVWLSPRFSSWTLGPVLPEIRCPVLIIHGDQDEYGSIQIPRFIRDRVGGPAEMHILRDCGHVPHREQPDVVAGLVDSFLRGG